MRVIVCGSRIWLNGVAVWSALDELLREHGTLVVVHGNCHTGADRYARMWAERHEFVGHEMHSANWEFRGRAAGPERNQRMADKGAGLCLAFWDGKSRGTGDMVRRASAAGIPVRIVAPLPNSPDPEAFA